VVFIKTNLQNESYPSNECPLFSFTLAYCVEARCLNGWSSTFAHNFVGSSFFTQETALLCSSSLCGTEIRGGRSNNGEGGQRLLTHFAIEGF